MFGVRLSSLFTSRWMALLWGVLICLSAVQFAGSRGQGAEDDADGAANAEQAARLAQDGAAAINAAF